MDANPRASAAACCIGLSAALRSGASDAIVVGAERPATTAANAAPAGLNVLVISPRSFLDAGGPAAVATLRSNPDRRETIYGPGPSVTTTITKSF